MIVFFIFIVNFNVLGQVKAPPLSKAQVEVTSSVDLYARGEFQQALAAVQKEIPSAEDATVEALLDMTLDIFSQDKKTSQSDIVKIYDLASKKKLNPYLTARIVNDKKVLQDWDSLVSLSPTGFLKKVDAAVKLPDPLTAPNHQRRSLLRFYSLVGGAQASEKSPERLLGWAKAEIAMGKSGTATLNTIKQQKNVSPLVMKEVNALLKKARTNETM